MKPFRCILAGAALLATNSAAMCAQARQAVAPVSNGTTTIAVSGSGVDQLTTAIIHSKENVPNGMIQKSTEIVDLTGAGDSVAATLTAALAVGADLEIAARLSNHAGAIVVMKEGAATASPDELRQSVKSREST